MAALFAGCSGLPSQAGRTETFALSDTANTLLGKAIAPDVAAHRGKSGIYPLDRPNDSFAARALLAAAAERTLDVQYYIWRGDDTGRLLFEALWGAAQRGVRVRLLLDDNGVAGLDDTLATLDAHPSIEVRLYNPFARRGGLRALGYATDFERLNRRMHNKSFTADNLASIVGGRNVGNEYFGAGGGTLFEDLDVLAIGEVVKEVSAAFDLYWNSASAYPAARLLRDTGAEGAARLEADFTAVRADPAALQYVRALRDTQLVQQLLGGRLPMDWADARVLRDDPGKTLDQAVRKDTLLLAELLRTTAQPKKSFDLISPYFVPGEEGTAALVALARKGVAVRVLTNSLEATDVGAVHAGYARRREDLLRGGVRLFELKRSSGQAKPSTPGGGAGSSSASLHAKTFALDRRHLFVGSFNFDPRSALLNTEMGLMIDSAVLAGNLAATLDADLDRVAYEVVMAGDRLQWIERGAAGEMRLDSEPGVGALRRGWIGLLQLLPIEWLL